MALSLRRITKKIGDVIGGVERQVNPFDQGATYSNPNPQLQPQQQQASFKQPALSVQPVQQPKFTIPTNITQPQQPLNVTVAKPQNLQLGNQTIAPSPTARTAPIQTIQTAQDRARQAIQRPPSFQDPLTRAARIGVQSFIGQPAAEISASVSGQTFRPTNPVSRAIVGNQPVKPVQQDIRGVYQAVKSGHQSLPGNIPISPSLAIPYAAAAGVLHAANDLPFVGGMTKGVTKSAKVISKEAAPLLKTAESARVPLNAAGGISADVAKAVPSVAPKVQTATTPISEQMSAAAQAERERYQKPIVESIRQKIAATADPYSELVKIDKAFAKTQGVKYRNLPAQERLDYLAARTASSGQQANEILKTPTRTGQSGYDLIQKYGEGNPQSREFNNYTNAKFDLEFRAKHGGKPIQKQYSTEDLANFVKTYETKNPQAIADAATKKALNDQAIDIMVKAGAISKKDGEFVKNYYEHAVPLSRIVPEDLSRVEIGGRSIGSIGRQSVLQKIKGNSEIPLEDSFAPLVSRIQKAVQQSNRAQLASKVLKRAQQGVVKDSNLLVGAGNKVARKFEKEQLGKTSQAINLARQNALTEAKKYLNSVTKDPDQKAAIDSLTYKDAEEIIKTVPSKRAAQISSNLKNAGLARSKVKTNIAQLQDDPTTGKQVISGLIDGEPFRLEVSPELATALQGLDEQKLNVVLKGLKAPIKVFQTAWTGFLNPVFSGISFAFYDTPMTIINSKLGFRTLGARAIAESIKSVNSNSEFQRILAQSGAHKIGGSQLPLDAATSAEAIAARKNIFSRIKFNAKNPKEALDSLDVIGGKLANATRTRVAKAHYINAKKAGMSEDAARAEAAYAYNNVLPDYNRTSNLVRQMNAIIPYTGASVAGTRSLATALRNNPATTVKLLGIGIAPMLGTAAYSLSSEDGQAFYKDMVDSGKQYLLDNNFVIVLPGAHKDGKTGKWTGVVKIPMAPELRALNQIAWRETSNLSNTTPGASPARVAAAMFDFSTGGLRTQENPLIDTGKVVLGIDPRSSNFSPKPLVSGDIAELPKSQQVYGTTSEAAKSISKLTRGAISPIQADSILGQFSTAGQIVQNKSGNPLVAAKDTVKNRFIGVYGKKDGVKYFEEFDKVTQSIPQSDDRKFFKTLHAKDPTPGILDNAEKAMVYLNRPGVVDAERKLDDWNRKQGKPGNPIFDLTNDQLQKVLAYRSAKMLNAGKQTYDKNGNPLFTSLGLDEQWYQNFRDKENAFYSSIKKSDGKDNGATFSGAQKPQASPELQAKLDQYYNLPKGTGARSRFLRANPDVLVYWNNSDGFVNKERAAIGLKPLEDNGGSGSGGHKSFGGFKRKQPFTNQYAYTVSPKAGKKLSRSVKVKNTSAKKVSFKPKTSTPKVSIKRSQV